MQALRMLFGLLALLLGACASMDVQTDYDRAADFSRYTTYAWVKVPQTHNPLMAERIMAAVDGQLSAKGWRKVAEGQADVAIDARVTAHENERVDTYYSGGPGFYGRWGGMGMASSTVTTYTVGTLVVDMFDAKTKQAIWRGTASDTVSDNPQKNAQLIQEGVQKMFQTFPPVH